MGRKKIWAKNSGAKKWSALYRKLVIFRKFRFFSLAKFLPIICLPILVLTYFIDYTLDFPKKWNKRQKKLALEWFEGPESEISVQNRLFSKIWPIVGRKYQK